MFEAVGHQAGQRGLKLQTTPGYPSGEPLGLYTRHNKQILEAIHKVAFRWPRGLWRLSC